MKSLKGVIVVSTIIAAAAVLGACEHGYKDAPMKFGAGDVSIEKSSS
jgi:hypothetical protein